MQNRSVFYGKIDFCNKPILPNLLLYLHGWPSICIFSAIKKYCLRNSTSVIAAFYTKKLCFRKFWYFPPNLAFYQDVRREVKSPKAIFIRQIFLYKIPIRVFLLFGNLQKRCVCQSSQISRTCSFQCR